MSIDGSGSHGTSKDSNESRNINVPAVQDSVVTIERVDRKSIDFIDKFVMQRQNRSMEGRRITSMLKEKVAPSKYKVLSKKGTDVKKEYDKMSDAMACVE